ncbi:MAG: family 10 glycosylhydrolase [Candidatus Marinimicrobia bacterium]|nr:family 10 glycosylhydrolase [Candidatus Neomarinimicrobiota bacterium]MCF7840072.1 family 10 glycosylhydrolase [Candidatus Neomarinimicrobiota bacterium]
MKTTAPIFNILTALLVTCLLLYSPTSLYAKYEESRGVWLTTVGGADWPDSHNAGSQQTQLRNMLDNLKSANMNTVFFQVRTRGCTFFPNPYEPMAAELTGTLGGDPGYDPLQYAITQAHNRGLEIHAWFNCFLVWSSNYWPPESTPPHPLNEHSDWRMVDNQGHAPDPNLGEDVFFSPGNPEVIAHTQALAWYLVENYDIDGIHFDYIRYPGTQYSYDAVSLARFYSDEGNPDNLTWPDWQRSQINQFVDTFYDSAIVLKPKVKVSAAVIGRYNTPPWNGYYGVFQDPQQWAENGNIDIIVPMIYWPIGDPYPFEQYLMDWVNNRRADRLLYAGMGTYKYEDDYNEVYSEIAVARGLHAEGHTHFRYDNLVTNTGFLWNLADTHYKNPANQPAMPWKDDIPPLGVDSLAIEPNEEYDYAVIRWPALRDSASDGEVVSRYNVYRAVDEPLSIINPNHLVSITTRPDTVYYDLDFQPGHAYQYAVTALDKLQNEGPASPILIYNYLSIDDTAQLPSTLTLEEPYPNPFNASVTLTINVPSQTPGTLRIYDLAGRLVKSLYTGELNSGMMQIIWQGDTDQKLPAASGIYLAVMESGETRQMKKLTLLK